MTITSSFLGKYYFSSTYLEKYGQKRIVKSFLFVLALYVKQRDINLRDLINHDFDKLFMYIFYSQILLNVHSLKIGFS